MPPLVAGDKESPAAAKSLVAGFKGYGKAGNYGVPVPPPCTLESPTRAPANAGEASGSQAPIYPFARGPTEDEIAEWMRESFEILPPMVTPIKVGQVVLWRGFKKGANGGDSTAEEFFRGEVHRIIPDDGHGTRYVLS